MQCYRPGWRARSDGAATAPAVRATAAAPDSPPRPASATQRPAAPASPRRTGRRNLLRVSSFFHHAIDDLVEQRVQLLVAKVIEPCQHLGWIERNSARRHRCGAIGGSWLAVPDQLREVR